MPVQPVSSPAARLLEESTETAAQSRTEAAHGDRQAIQRIARLQQQQAQATPPANPPGTATVVDVRA